jgi:hypothetical protein
MIEKKPPHGIIMFTTLPLHFARTERKEVVHWHLSSRDH